MNKLTGKAGKLFRQYIGEGLTPAYARRKAVHLAKGETLAQARGHKEELLRVPKRRPKRQKMPRSRLDATKADWQAYVFQDVLGYSDDDSYPLSPFSMSSYDHTKKSFKNYDWESLFAIHQFMERAVEFAFPEWLNDSRKTKINEGYVDFQEDAKYKHRQYEWKMFDEDGELRYYLTYEKGEFQSRQMWEEFDFFQMKLELREQRIWE
jgi:hypothetical protein